MFLAFTLADQSPRLEEERRRQEIIRREEALQERREERENAVKSFREALHSWRSNPREGIRLAVVYKSVLSLDSAPPGSQQHASNSVIEEPVVLQPKQPPVPAPQPALVPSYSSLYAHSKPHVVATHRPAPHPLEARRQDISFSEALATPHQMNLRQRRDLVLPMSDRLVEGGPRARVPYNRAPPPLYLDESPPTSPRSTGRRRSGEIDPLLPFVLANFGLAVLRCVGPVCGGSHAAQVSAAS